jgi:glycosyltransferase involved in cell wall biosynthesis
VSPLVSCLMVTADRPGLASRAIKCHAHQTYENTELVILDDGSVDYSSVISAHGAPGRVRYVRIPRDPALTLGDLRNMSMELAQGDWMIQWDDDEWYAPTRIETQLNSALAGGTGACALKWTLVRIEGNGSIMNFRAETGTATPGTILYRRCESRYPSLRRNEDGVFMASVARELGMTVLGREHSHLFVRIHHGANTWSRAHFEQRLRRTPAQWPAWLVARYLRRDITTLGAFRLTDDELTTVESVDRSTAGEVLHVIS